VPIHGRGVEGKVVSAGGEREEKGVFHDD